MMPVKPLYGTPCNGCGLCCIAEQCPLSVEAFGPQPICPALIDTGDRYACGLVARPDLYFPADRAAAGAKLCGELLGVGTYCDATCNAEDDAAYAAMHGKAEA